MMSNSIPINRQLLIGWYESCPSQRTRLNLGNNEPYRLNYRSRYPLGIRERLGATFAQDIVGAIDIRVQGTPISRPV